MTQRRGAAQAEEEAARAGMAEMSATFQAMGSEVYVPADAVATPHA
jgi:hypothetical protein